MTITCEARHSLNTWPAGYCVETHDTIWFLWATVTVNQVPALMPLLESVTQSLSQSLWCFDIQNLYINDINWDVRGAHLPDFSTMESKLALAPRGSPQTESGFMHIPAHTACVQHMRGLYVMQVDSASTHVTPRSLHVPQLTAPHGAGEPVVK